MASSDTTESKKGEAVDLDTIILAGIERGLTMADIKMMTIGEVVDFVIAYNDRVKEAEKEAEKEEKKDKKRKATQRDIDAFFG